MKLYNLVILVCFLCASMSIQASHSLKGQKSPKSSVAKTSINSKKQSIAPIATEFSQAKIDAARKAIDGQLTTTPHKTDDGIIFITRNAQLKPVHAIHQFNNGTATETQIHPTTQKKTFITYDTKGIKLAKQEGLDLSGLSNKKPSAESDTKAPIVTLGTKKKSLFTSKKPKVDSVNIELGTVEGPSKLTLSVNEYKAQFKKVGNDPAKIDQVVDGMIRESVLDKNIMNAIKKNPEYLKFRQQVKDKLLKDINKPSMAEKASENIATALQFVRDIQWTKIAEQANKSSGKVASAVIKQIGSIFNDALIQLNKITGTKFEVREDSKMSQTRMQNQRIGKQIDNINARIKEKTSQLDFANKKLSETQDPFLIKKYTTDIIDLNKAIGNFNFKITELKDQQKQLTGDIFDSLGHLKSKSTTPKSEIEMVSLSKTPVAASA